MTDHTLAVTLNLDTEQLAAELCETLRRHIAAALMADRYAANEARQREEELEDAWQSRDWESVRHLQDEAKQQEEAEPDPLDEDDHRDRLDADGTEWRRTIGGCWHPTIGNIQSRRRCHCNLAYVQSLFGPLTFAPDVAPQATGGDLSDPEGESGAEEREAANDSWEPPLPCPYCGHDLEDHCAYSLIAEAVNAEREMPDRLMHQTPTPATSWTPPRSSK